MEQSQTMKEELKPKYISLLNRLMNTKGIKEADMDALFYMIRSLNHINLAKTAFKGLNQTDWFYKELSKEKVIFVTNCCEHFGGGKTFD